MKVKASILATLTFAPLWARAGFAETRSIQPNSDDRQLNACFQLQQPEPWPETRPDAVPDQRPEQWPDQQPGHRTSADDQQESPMQTVIGTIVKEHGKYVLKAWDKKTYQIDDQDRAKKYEGELVKIVGHLELSTNTIRIQSIELKS